MLLAPPTSFNHASSPFSCHNHSLHIVRIILLVTECQKGSRLHCLSISDSHILQIYIGYEDNHLWLWASRSTVYGEFLQNPDDKTLQYLYHWLHSEHFLVPQLSRTLHYPFPQTSHHSQKLIYLKSQAALQMGKCFMILNNSSVSPYACIFHS